MAINTAAIVQDEFPWLSTDDVDIVLKHLDCLTEKGSFKDQMAAASQRLYDLGLFAGPGLLKRLVGGGSKSTASDIVSEQMRLRFQERIQAMNKSAEPILTASPTPADPAQPPPQVIDVHVGALIERLDEVVAGIVKHVERVDSNINWLKSTIDTERQLRRYMEQKGPLPEPSPPQRNTELTRRVINNLHQQLSDDYSGRGALPNRDGTRDAAGSSPDLPVE